jgi:hypothetical protein
LLTDEVEQKIKLECKASYKKFNALKDMNILEWLFDSILKIINLDQKSHLVGLLEKSIIDSAKVNTNQI